MAKIISTDIETLSSLNDDLQLNWVLKGLARGQVGAIVGPPDSGKGYLAMSIAVNGALNFDFLNLKAVKNFNTVIWPKEDSIEVAGHRLLEFKHELPHSATKILNERIHFIDEHNSLITISGNVKTVNQSLIDDFSELLKSVSADLFIIDTIRSAIMPGDEVEDDRLVLEALTKLSASSNTAVLIVHHPTKNVARGADQISSVSGSGLSKTLAASRYGLYLSDKKGKSNLEHFKHNNIKKSERLNTEVMTSNSGILYANEEQFKISMTEQSYLDKPIVLKKTSDPVDLDLLVNKVQAKKTAKKQKAKVPKKDKNTSVLKEPLEEVELDKLLSESNTYKSDDLLSEEESKEYELWLTKNGKA